MAGVQIPEIWFETCRACPGMCRSACPAFTFNGDELHTPRTFVLTAFQKGLDDDDTYQRLSVCHNCSLCTQACEAGVDPSLVVTWRMSRLSDRTRRISISLPKDGVLLIPGEDGILASLFENDAWLSVARFLGLNASMSDEYDIGISYLLRGRARDVKISLQGDPSSVDLVSLSPRQWYHARKLARAGIEFPELKTAHEVLAPLWNIRIHGKRDRVILHIPCVFDDDQKAMLLSIFESVADVIPWEPSIHDPWACMEPTIKKMFKFHELLQKVGRDYIFISPCPVVMQTLDLSGVSYHNPWSYLARIVEAFT